MVAAGVWVVEFFLAFGNCFARVGELERRRGLRRFFLPLAMVFLAFGNGFAGVTVLGNKFFRRKNYLYIKLEVPLRRLLSRVPLGIA